MELKTPESSFWLRGHIRQGKKPSFFVAQRALSIETSFRVIGIQIFYPWHPGFFFRIHEGWLRRVARKKRQSQNARETEGKVSRTAGGGTGKKELKRSKGKEGNSHKERTEKTDREKRDEERG